jgi:hypothetical protein
MRRLQQVAMNGKIRAALVTALARRLPSPTKPQHSPAHVCDPQGQWDKQIVVNFNVRSQ